MVLKTNSHSIVDLTQFAHQLLDEAIVIHQECLLEQELEWAQQSFDLYCRLMQAHIEVENNIIFPLWRQLLDTQDKAQVKWPFVIYQKEHEKLLKMLAKAQSFLDQCRVPALTRQARRRAILQALEYQRSLKNVAEHHEQREEQGLLPELQQALSLPQSQDLISQCNAIWQPGIEQADLLMQQLKQNLA